MLRRGECSDVPSADIAHTMVGLAELTKFYSRTPGTVVILVPATSRSGLTGPQWMEDARREMPEPYQLANRMMQPTAEFEHFPMRHEVGRL